MPDGTWGTCVGEIGPQPETCNNLDDDCDGVVDNGFDKQHDVNNCGTCGHVCYAPNATPSCVNGTCGIAVCDEGWGDCDGILANGCEHDVSSDVNNCGFCGNVCGECFSGCSNSACVPASSGTPCTGGMCDGTGNCV
jgi:hypothetical protein